MNYIYLWKDEFQYVLCRRGVTSLSGDVTSYLRLVRQTGATESGRLNLAESETSDHLAIC